MIDYKILFGSLALVIAFISYIPYFRDIIKGKTKPHAYSWLVWTSLTAIAYFGQLFDDAGSGAWATGFTAIISVVIFLFALKKGEKQITKSDKLSLVGAAIALLLWFVTNNPLSSIILITIIDAAGFYPTFRKSYHKPFEETNITYFLSGLKFLFAIIALNNYTVVTYLYPLSLVIMNWVFVLMLIIRRKQSSKKQGIEHGF